MRLVVCMLTCFLAWGCRESSPPKESTPPKGTFALTGRVVDIDPLPAIGGESEPGGMGFAPDDANAMLSLFQAHSLNVRWAEARGQVIHIYPKDAPAQADLERAKERRIWIIFSGGSRTDHRFGVERRHMMWVLYEVESVWAVLP